MEIHPEVGFIPSVKQIGSVLQTLTILVKED
jgi:hypothetical protein